jgi:acyl-coenzyme A thioesterase PaaI-like protein
MTKSSPFPPMRTLSNGVTLCRGCDPADTCRLGLSHLAVDIASSTVTSSARCPGDWEGGPGVAHGGWIACIFDEVLGMLPARLDVPCVTASLNVDFLKPVPIERLVVASGRVESHVGRRWVVLGTIKLAEDSTEVARAIAHLVEPRPGHFDKLRR